MRKLSFFTVTVVALACVAAAFSADDPATDQSEVDSALVEPTPRPGGGELPGAFQETADLKRAIQRIERRTADLEHAVRELRQEVKQSRAENTRILDRLEAIQERLESRAGNRSWLQVPEAIERGMKADALGRMLRPRQPVVPGEVIFVVPRRRFPSAIREEIEKGMKADALERLR